MMIAATMRTSAVAAAALLIGYAAGQSSSLASAAAQSAVKPAYLIVSSKALAPEKMGPYRQKAVPLALAAGMETIAAGDPKLHVLEGAYTLDGTITIERYRSMDDLLAFWNSPGYQEAKKLREGLAQMNFIVAIEGR